MALEQNPGTDSGTDSAERQKRFGSEVIVSFGDTDGEVEALRTTVGLIERSDLLIGRMWGRDPVRMLNGLITNDLNQLSPTRAVYAGILTPKGKFISDIRIWASPETEGEVLFDFPAIAREELTTHLTKFTPPMFARWELVDDAKVLGIHGPAASEALVSLGATVTSVEVDEVVPVDGIGPAARSAALGGDGFDVLVRSGTVTESIERLNIAVSEVGGRAVGIEAFEEVRIARGRPRFGVDFGAETLPAEVYIPSGDMDRAISFSKGCYTGQEVVVRLAHRGHVNRQLRAFRLEGDLEDETELKVFSPEGKEVGWISSLSRPAGYPRMALGYARREVAAGSYVYLGSPDGERAEVIEIGSLS